MTKIKEFIHKNKKIIIVILAFVLLNVTILLAWKITRSKDEEISPSAPMNNSTENNQQDINNQPSNTNPNTVQRQFSDGTVIVYDKVTENIIKKIFPDGTIQEYDSNQLIKVQFTNESGQICEYDTNTKNAIKRTTLKNDGSGNPLIIVEYEPKQGKKIKQTDYQNDSDKKKTIAEYDPENYEREIIIKTTSLKPDGENPLVILEYDKGTGFKSQQTTYQNENESIKEIIAYNPQQDGKKINVTLFKPDGKNPLTVLEYDQNTDHVVRRTDYHDNSNNKKTLTEYYPGIILEQKIKNELQLLKKMMITKL
ncbi:DUF2963 domain-containing protein [Candidatus Phytoplasma pruni]|uniref:DUF2963 domain-containing protein n=1 Tax=Candidatus Phytoplasma pruni TaxID=479893 RepID=A0A851HCG2_9MOLU|nr:hypothetical protein [Candidatus Phytoplasma pruni]NWN45678.1 hypothetical protein [Candidatus Phytoplasma pruni]